MTFLKPNMNIDQAIALVEKMFVDHHPLNAPMSEQRTDEEWDAIDCSKIANVTALDGFLTAVVSAPNMIAPSVWLPAVWGGTNNMPKWDTVAQYQDCLNAMMSLYNRVASEFAAGEFWPLLPEVNEDEPRLISTLWAIGYREALALWDLKDADMLNISAHLARIFVHSESESVYESVDEVEDDVNDLIDAVYDIQAYFYKQRTKSPRLTNKRGATKSPKPLKRKKRLH